jgi:hypothetical protein
MKDILNKQCDPIVTHGSFSYPFNYPYPKINVLDSYCQPLAFNLTDSWINVFKNKALAEYGLFPPEMSHLRKDINENPFSSNLFFD